MITDEFYELFEIPKVEYRTPGRTYDDDGELCEEYIDYEYPSIEPVYFDLLNLYEVQYHGRPLVVNLTEYNLRKYLMDGLVELYKSYGNSKKEIESKLELKADIKEIFKDYYGE